MTKQGPGAIALIAFLTLAGCAGTRQVPSNTAPAVQFDSWRAGDEVAMRALAMIGVPYRYGGSGPDSFDCSGLVQYIYREVGIDVPRTAAQQYAAVQRVEIDEIAPGDLLFFRIRGSISHVAIYAGEGRFVHAPQSGRTVELRALGDEFYRPRLVRAGRLVD